MINRRINNCVESICNQGCRVVRFSIEALKDGTKLAETEGLSAAEKSEVLLELEEIMEVYVDGCNL